MSGGGGASARGTACMRWGRQLCLGLPWVCLALAILIFRIHAEGTRELERSDRAFDRGELGAALDHARQAALWYVPAAPHVEQALQRLRAIAIGAEAGGDQQLALRAWGALRSVLHETHHFGAMQVDLWRASNQAAQRLLPGNRSSLPRSVRRSGEPASEQLESGPASALEPAARTRSSQAQVRRAGYANPQGPAPHWALATTLGMSMMLVAGGWLSARARSWSASWWARLAFAAGLSLWVIAALGA